MLSQATNVEGLWRAKVGAIVFEIVTRERERENCILRSVE